MAAEVKGCKPDSVDGQFLGCWVQRRHGLGHSVIFQHVKQSCFAGIVKSKKEKFAIFFPQTQIPKSPGEPVPKKHFCCFSLLGKIKIGKEPNGFSCRSESSNISLVVLSPQTQIPKSPG